MPINMALRAELAYRIRTISPADWSEFSQLWMAFNAIYGGEPDRNERARVMACVRRAFTERAALRVLRSVTRSAERILEIPPGNMLLDITDPNFRVVSERCAGIYRDNSQSAVERLVAVAGILYQVRCNLIHGSKDPDSERDRMLVRESLAVLQVLVPALEKELM